MIAARKDLDITGLEVCDNTSESVWAKLLIKGHSPLLVGCYYRRDADSSVEQVEELDKVLTHIDENYNKNASCTILYLVVISMYLTLIGKYQHPGIVVSIS